MSQISISRWREMLSQKQMEGATKEELAAAWREAATTLPNPSPEWDLAHHQVNAAAHDLGIGALTSGSWRHPTTLGQFKLRPGSPEPVGVQWAEEYYKGCAIVCHVEGEQGAWSYRVFTVLPDFSETAKVEERGFPTIADAYAAGMASQIKLIDQRD